MRSALDSKASNKRVHFDKSLPVLEQRDQHKHPSKEIEVIEVDPALRLMPKNKAVTFVDELDKRKQKPIFKRTRAQNPPVTRVLANISPVSKASLNLTDLFKKCLVAMPAVICFILNAPVVMKLPEKLLRELKMSEAIPELEENETTRMTDAVFNMKENGFDRLKYVQTSDTSNEEEDNSDFDKLWNVKRLLRHKEEYKKIELYLELNDPNKK